jgi:hypothetical protein
VALRHIAEMIYGCVPSGEYGKQFTKSSGVIEKNLLREATKMDYFRKQFSTKVEFESHKEYESRRLMSLGKPYPTYLFRSC